jgi:hypothetical protein
MMLRIESLLVLLAASATMAGLPDEGRGQPATSAKHPPEADASPGPALEARARKMAEQGRTGWATAASLYARAGHARGSSDEGAPRDLVLAGHLYFYVGEHEASVLAFRAAGQLFLALGLLDSAAGAFRDGAWVAAQAGLEREAQELCEWTEVLTRRQPQGQPGQRRFFAGAARSS